MKKLRSTFWLAAMTTLSACPQQSDLRQLQVVPQQRAAEQQPKATADFNFCLRKALTRADYLKFIFVLDKSGSNAGDATTPGTDPNGARRYGTLLSYLGTIPSENQSNTFYTLVQFSTDVTVLPAVPPAPAAQTNFTNNLPSFTSLVRTQANPAGSNPANPNDSGWTDYIVTLNRLKTLISNDIAQASLVNPPVRSHYVIIWASDGVPLIPTGVESTTSILNLVRDLRSFEVSNPTLVGSVQLHTGYYYNDAAVDNDAKVLMQQMAATGNGDAFQFSTGQSIDFTRFQIPQDNVKFTLKDFFVTYVNGAWDNAKFMVDSKGSGMSDKQKLAMGADPNKTDSDGNGISDLVEWKAFGRPCHGDHCEPEQASQFPNCAAFRIDPNDPHSGYIDSDSDGLNDCEETILESDPQSFDSNDAWVPDLLAFQRGFGLASGRGALALDSDGDAVPAYYELKYNTPLDYRNDLVPGIMPYQYHLDLVSTSAVQDCYKMSVSNIQVLDPNHQLRAYLMEMPAALEAKKYLRQATKTIGAGLHPVFNDGDFQ